MDCVRRQLGLLAMAALACAVGGVFLPACDRDETPRLPEIPEAPRNAPPKVSARPGRPWPIYRGNRSLTGVAEGTLADRYKVLWRFATDDEVRSSPTVSGGVVYVGSFDNHVYAIDLASGKQKWAFDAKDLVESPPLVLDGVVYVGCDNGTLYALSASDGSRRWTFATQDRIAGSATWFRDAHGALRILIASYDSRLYCLDAAGQKLWQYESDDRINGTAAIADGTAVLGGCDAHIHVVNLADGKGVRKIDVGSYIPGSSVLVGSKAYVVNDVGSLVCADVDQGRILWRYEGLTSPIVASPAVSDREVVIGTQGNKLHCIDLATRKQRWEFAARDFIDASPVICGRRVVAGTLAGRLYVLDLADGKVVWSFEAGKGLASSPAVVGGMIIVGGLDGSVFALAPK